MALTKISTDGVKDDAITKAKIPADQIEASELANNAVDTNAIQDDAVTEDKLANSINSAIAANTAKVSTTINNNADNKIITGSGTANTLEGEALAQIDSDGDLWIGHAPTTHYDNRKMFIHQPTAGETAYLSITGEQGAGIVFGDSVGQNTGNYESLIWHNNSDDSLKITTDNGNKGIKIENGGDVEVIDGNVKFANGHGIDFSATGDGSGTMSSELLDDYEEGTWTPVIKNEGQTPTWTGVSGRYTKIGEQVTVWFNADGGSTPRSGGAGTSLIMTGMPFAISMFGNPILGVTGANDHASSGLYSTSGLILNVFGQGGSQVRFGSGGQPINKAVNYVAGCFTYTAA